MKIVELISADIYRDGGSYGAQFLADDGQEFRGPERPADCVPVVTGSDQERDLFERLSQFLAAPSVRLSKYAAESAEQLQWLRELADYAVRREPCSPRTCEHTASSLDVHRP